jgi:pimaricinolide synthase PimS1
LWETKTELGGGVTGSDLQRMKTLGVPAMPTVEGLALFDEALTVDEAVLVPIKVDAGASTGNPPTLLRDVLKAPARKPERAAASVAAPVAASAGTLEQRLSGVNAKERNRIVLDVVRTEVSVVSQIEAGAIDVSKGFTELGLDSLAAIDLRNRLQSATGLRLPATLMFDYPNPTSMAEFVLSELDLDDSVPEEPALDDDAIRRQLESIPLEKMRNAGLLDALLRLAEPVPDKSEAIKSMAVDDLIKAALAIDTE